MRGPEAIGGQGAARAALQATQQTFAEHAGGGGQAGAVSGLFAIQHGVSDILDARADNVLASVASVVSSLALFAVFPTSPQKFPNEPDGRSGPVRANPLSPIAIAEFKAVIDHFHQDIREFFIRSHFYMAVQVALLSAFAVRGLPSGTSDDILSEYVLSLAIVIAGIVLVGFWYYTAAGAIRWIDRWRDEVRSLSGELCHFKSFYRVEAGTKEHPKKDPTWVTSRLPWLFLILCLWYSELLVFISMCSFVVLSCRLTFEGEPTVIR